MKEIDGKIVTWLGDQKDKRRATVQEVRVGDGVPVKTIRDLIFKVAVLSFFNQKFQMFFRWQKDDCRSGIEASTPLASTILPSILRGSVSEFGARFAKLEAAENKITELDCFSRQAMRWVGKKQAIRWALIQHYEVCETPFLDVTHSLRVACSFASIYASTEKSSLYVLGITHMTSRNTKSHADGIQAVRLLSTCPPLANRPHFQEGYLFGEHPKLNLATLQTGKIHEWDFSRRLICKFSLPPADDKFWDGESPLPKESLFPTDDDFLEFASQITNSIR